MSGPSDLLFRVSSVEVVAGAGIIGASSLLVSLFGICGGAVGEKVVVVEHGTK